MKYLNYSYSEEENGWATPKEKITGDIYLIITLKEKGRVTITRSHTEDGPHPKVYVSPIEGPRFEIKLYGDTEGKYIRIITSTEPQEIKYGNI